jgi:hypothetical protein
MVMKKLDWEEKFPNVSFTDKVAIHFEDGSVLEVKHLYHDKSALTEKAHENSKLNLKLKALNASCIAPLGTAVRRNRCGRYHSSVDPRMCVSTHSLCCDRTAITN